jgi:Lon protease-like protein
MSQSANLEGLSDALKDAVLIPDIIPVFPLPGVVLLPGEVLPLHIFEPRYREMMHDALANFRVIGLVEPEPDVDLAGAPPLQQRGCLGLIAQHRQLGDGRYLIWLLGLERFRIDNEIDAPTGYRQVKVTYLPDNDSPEELVGMAPLKKELRHTLPLLVNVDDATRKEISNQLEGMSGQQLVAFASQVLELTPQRKRELQEADSVTARCLMVSEDLYSRIDPDAALGELAAGSIN